jgi:hypothetical protein
MRPGPPGGAKARSRKSLDPGWAPVSRLREALARLVVRLDASAGEGRSEKIMLDE